jgi:pyruvate dehydrogenase E1 component
VPTIRAYDPAYAYEQALIVQDGIRRMYEAAEDCFYYITLGNENYPMPALPEGGEEGVLKGMYKLRAASKSGERGGSAPRCHLLGSGSILRETLRAQEMLADRFGVAADVWSVTSYQLLRRDALETERWNLLHPTEKPRVPYVRQLLGNDKDVLVAASDYQKLVPEMIQRWLPELYALGTDGFGRSEGRSDLRRFFEVDAEFIALATLAQLARKGEIKPAVVQQAIKDLKIDPDKANPMCS